MSRIRAPEFRGKIRGQLGRSRRANSARLLLTKKINFVFPAFPAVLGLAVLAVFSSAIAETRFYRAAPLPCATPFALPDLAGRTHALAEESGRPVLVHFFATWCEPCKAELGSLRRFADQRAGRIRVLALNVGEVPGRVRRFLDDSPVNFPVLLDADRAVATAWDVEGLPTTVLLDGTLRPRLTVTGDQDWASAEMSGEIDRILASPAESPDAVSDDARCTPEARR